MARALAPACGQLPDTAHFFKEPSKMVVGWIKKGVPARKAHCQKCIL
jgi:hypothetical protein